MISEKANRDSTAAKTAGYGSVSITMLLTEKKRSSAMPADLTRPHGCTSVSPNAIATTPSAMVVPMKEFLKINSAGIIKKAIETITFRAHKWLGLFQNTLIQKSFIARFIDSILSRKIGRAHV